ncbi:MAG: hypothetical protein HYR60_14590 [Acidobacteria bacterium]|nr:hypothetical protein [Acidobacteriota bacterium]
MFDPLIAGWFGQRFPAATEPQLHGWPEIHAVADDKRGSHLALSLARLDRLAGTRAADRPVGDRAAHRAGRAFPRR